MLIAANYCGANAPVPWQTYQYAFFVYATAAHFQHIRAIPVRVSEASVHAHHDNVFL